MRDLLARLALQDEDASNALRVLDYFNALDERSPGPEAYLRGAAALTGHVAGMELPDRELLVRFHPSGRRLTNDPSARLAPSTLTRVVPRRGEVWLEDSPGDTTSELVIERMASGVQQWLDRIDAAAPTPSEAWAMLLNDPLPADRRRQLLHALRLDPTRAWRVVAHLPHEPIGRPLHAVALVWGVEVGASVQRADASVDLTTAPGGTMGIGPRAESLEELNRSWECAVAALRLARPGEALVWSRLGVLGPLFMHADAAQLMDDPVVRAIATEDLPWLDETVTAVTQAGSVRGASEALHLHHSTVQKRVDKLHQMFDLDLSNARHVHRVWLACAAYRFATFGNAYLSSRTTPAPARPPAAS